MKDAIVMSSLQRLGAIGADGAAIAEGLMHVPGI